MHGCTVYEFYNTICNDNFLKEALPCHGTSKYRIQQLRVLDSPLYAACLYLKQLATPSVVHHNTGITILLVSISIWVLFSILNKSALRD